LIGVQFYATYAVTRAGLARFGEALRRELKGEDIRVPTACRGVIDTPVTKSNRGGPDLDVLREPASAVADALVEGIENDYSRSSFRELTVAAGRLSRGFKSEMADDVGAVAAKGTTAVILRADV